MRALTAAEATERDRRRAGLLEFLDERMPVLADFAKRLQLQNPNMIVAEPSSYVDEIGATLANQEVTSDDREWLLARVGYLIGEVLAQRLGGHWFLNEIPDSRFFLRYVVGAFSAIPNPRAMIDPFEVAAAYVDAAKGRSLKGLIDDVCGELFAA